MSLIQLLPLSIHNDKAFSALLNTYPHLGHAIEIAPDAPLHSGPFHTVAETALDRFDVAVVSTVPLGQPLLPLMEIDGDSAQLGLSIFPGLKLVVPAVNAHRIVQAVLYGPVGDIGDSETLGFLLVGCRDTPLNIPVGEGRGERLAQLLRCFLPHKGFLLIT